MMDDLDFACVIHGDMYPWMYIENLHSMIRRHLPVSFRFHVFTEPDRPVPAPMIKQPIHTWSGVQGNRSAWWYKMQLFDPARGLGRVLYLDLDTVIVNDLSWLGSLDPAYFWTIRDFKYLWRPDWQGINSSLMLFDASRFAYVWQNLQSTTIQQVRQQFRGDQDYLTHIIPKAQTKFIPADRAQSWRWQVYQGGLDMKTRCYRDSSGTTKLPPQTSLVVFHGQPKPHDIPDPVIKMHWQ